MSHLPAFNQQSADGKKENRKFEKRLICHTLTSTTLAPVTRVASLTSYTSKDNKSGIINFGHNIVTLYLQRYLMIMLKLHINFRLTVCVDLAMFEM